MNYEEGGLVFYSACRYDEEGRLQEAVEYDAQGEEKPLVLFHRYEYPEPDREEQYTYIIQGSEFGQVFGDGDQVRLVLSENDLLSAIEMTNVSENKPETYEFAISDENAGQILRMCIGTDAAEGEEEALKILEKEAERSGFRAGENLNDNTEGSRE